MIKIDFSSYMKNDINYEKYDDKISIIKNQLETGTSLNDWYDINKCISQEEIKEILDISKYIQNNCDVFLVIGIGGSYLGSNSIIESLDSYYGEKKTEVIFAGTSLSSYYLNDLKEYLKDKDVIVNVISKSGETLEPMITYNVILEELKKKYTEDELKDRIIITTDETDGTLRKLAVQHNYKSFTVPRNIGGRYSVLTVCGLLPISVAGFDIVKILEGAKSCNKEDAFKYSIIRDILYRDGKLVEAFTVYEPKLKYFTKWLKQLFAETQGKDEKGILPISVINTTDLHSLGQFIQQGNKIMFETVISILNTSDLHIKKYNRSLDEINSIAAHKVAEAHYSSGVYSNFIEIDKLDEFSFGYLIYFFEVAAAAGAYLLNVNPFDQPGVNAYKDLINKELND